MKHVLALAALGAAALPATADASSARFVAYVEGRQVTTWEMPRYQIGAADCQGTQFRTASGSETVTFRTKPARLRAYRPNPKAGVMLTYGAWGRFAAGKPHLAATGTITRAYSESLEWEPGPCGAPAPQPARFNDCGSERWTPEVRLSWVGKRVEVDADSSGIPFVNCELRSPTGVEQGDFTDTVSQRYPARDLFDRSQGLVEVLGRKTFTEQFDHGTTTTTVTWKLRLRRAR